MKKRIILILILILIITVLPLTVKASSLSVECDTTIVKSQSLNCTIKGSASSTITSVSAKVSTGNNISLTSFTPNSVWKGDGDDGNIDLYTASDVTGNFDIGTISFKVNTLYDGGTSSITIEQISFYDENGIEESIATVTKDITIAATNNDLSSLSLSNGNINPVFNKDTLSYSTQINADSVVISAKSSSNKATITGTGTKTLNYGNNNFKITICIGGFLVIFFKEISIF